MAFVFAHVAFALLQGEVVQVVAEGVQDADVETNNTDSGVVRQLKEKLARQATFYEASAKAMQDFMSFSMDERKKWQEDAVKEIESLREELAGTKQLLQTQKPAVRIFGLTCSAGFRGPVAFSFLFGFFQHDVVDQMFVNLFPRDMTNREQFIEGIEDDLKKSLDDNCTSVQERTAEERKRELQLVRDEYDERARQTHLATKEREVVLCNRIAQLMRELRVRSLSLCHVAFIKFDVAGYFAE